MVVSAARLSHLVAAGAVVVAEARLFQLVAAELELELGLIQIHMIQKPMLQLVAAGAMVVAAAHLFQLVAAGALVVPAKNVFIDPQGNPYKL